MRGFAERLGIAGGMVAVLGVFASVLIAAGLRTNPIWSCTS